MGYHPEVILSGRRINDSMGSYIARRGVKMLAASGHPLKDARIGILGLTFKENVPDLRNSKIADLIAELGELGHEVTVHDPLADSAEAQHEYSLTLDAEALEGTYDLVLLAVPHRAYRDMGSEALRQLLAEGGTLADLKGTLDGQADWTL